MKIVKGEKPKYDIQIGDLVEYEGKECMVSYLKTIITCKNNDICEYVTLQYPYRLLNLKTGKIIQGYSDLETLNNSDNIKLLAKNKDIVMKYY